MVNEAAAASLSKRGIRIGPLLGSGNYLHIPHDFDKQNLDINFNGRSNNIVVLNHTDRFGGSLLFGGNGHIFVANRSGPAWFNVEFYENTCGAYVGEGTTAVSVKLHVQGKSVAISIGDDCLMSWGIDIRTSDGHGVIDLISKQVRNAPKSVVIGPHVWLGFNTSIRKGVTVGKGSIVGSGTIVPKSLKSFCSAAGMPARVVRNDTTWTRSPYPSPEDIRVLLERDYMADYKPVKSIY